MTVKELRAALEGVNDDVEVIYQRIEDVYFDKHHWKALELPWFYGEKSLYIATFCAYETKEYDGTVYFRLDAHY